MPALYSALRLLPGLPCSPYTKGSHSPPSETSKSMYQASGVMQEISRVYDPCRSRKASQKRIFHTFRGSAQALYFSVYFSLQS